MFAAAVFVAAVFVAAVAAALVGCSPSEPDGAGEADAASAAAPERATRAGVTAGGNHPPSPLEEVTGLSSDAGRRNQQVLTMQRRANETVMSCMAEAGFDYWVEPVGAGSLLGPRSGDGTRGWVEVNGLGITISLIELSRPPTTGVALDSAAANLAYTQTLTPDQAEAYDRALVGVGGTEGLGQFAPDGCWSRAYADVIPRMGFLQEFDGELADLARRIESDPRVGAMMENWSACMAERGHPYTNRGQLVDDLFARLLSIDFVEDVAGRVEFTDPGAVDELLVAEIAVGVDDWDCRQGIADELTELRAAYEREFLADNGSRIGQMFPVQDE